MRPFRLWISALAFLLIATASIADDAESCACREATAHTKPNAEHGRVLFEERCALCHGEHGTGARGPDLRAAVSSGGLQSLEVASIIRQGIPPDMPEGWYFSDQDLVDLAEHVVSLGRSTSVPMNGSPERGRVVFDQSGCMACHILEGRGKGFGPELSRIGASHSSEELRRILLDPASAVPAGYLWIEVITTSGTVIRGIRRNEDTLTLQIQDATGRYFSLVKSELRALDRRPHETPMPAIGKALSRRDLDDLVAFLSVQRQVR